MTQRQIIMQMLDREIAAAEDIIRCLHSMGGGGRTMARRIAAQRDKLLQMRASCRHGVYFFRKEDAARAWLASSARGIRRCERCQRWVIY